MVTITEQFTDVGVSTPLFVRKGDAFTYTVDLSADFDGALILRRTRDNGISYETIASFAVEADNVTDVKVRDGDGTYSFVCSLGAEATLTGTADIILSEIAEVIHEFKNQSGVSVFQVTEEGIVVNGVASVSGVVTASSSIVRASQKRIINVGAKVGTTAGFVVEAANDLGLLATCPAAQTASTLVVPVPGLKVGDTITSFHLIGQIEGAGNTVTVDADLRKLTAAAADVTDASVGAITQLSVIADTIMSASNTAKTVSEVVGADETFYILITATTGADTDIGLQGVAIVVSEA